MLEGLVMEGDVYIPTGPYDNRHAPAKLVCRLRPVRLDPLHRFSGGHD